MHVAAGHCISAHWIASLYLLGSSVIEFYLLYLLLKYHKDWIGVVPKSLLLVISSTSHLFEENSELS